MDLEVGGISVIGSTITTPVFGTLIIVPSSTGSITLAAWGGSTSTRDSQYTTTISAVQFKEIIMANGYTTGTKINFDINSALDEAEKNGIFTAAEAAKIRKKNAASGLSEQSAGSQAAGIAGLVGGQISASDSQGTDSTTQALGGAASGAATGFAVGGPWGAAIGGVIGGVQGALGASQARKARDQKIESERVTNIANIQSNATASRNANVNNLISNLSRTLVSGR